MKKKRVKYRLRKRTLTTWFILHPTDDRMVWGGLHRGWVSVDEHCFAEDDKGVEGFNTRHEAIQYAEKYLELKRTNTMKSSERKPK